MNDLRAFRTLNTARSWIEASVSLLLYVGLWIANWKLIPVSILAAVGGLAELAIVQLPICIFAASIAGWLFFVQHHFKDAVWKKSRADGWNYYEGAVRGSSYLKLSRPLGEWLWLGIGYHHVHHLDAKIPCYRLGNATAKVEDRLDVPSYTFLQTLPFARLAVWDEAQARLGTET